MNPPVYTITLEQLGQLCSLGTHLEQQLYKEVVRLTEENQKLQGDDHLAIKAALMDLQRRMLDIQRESESPSALVDNQAMLRISQLTHFVKGEAYP